MPEPEPAHPAAHPVADSIWGDESEITTQVLDLVRRRISRLADSSTTARPASELAAAAGRTITPGGLGSFEALRIFEDVLAPATAAQDHPYNLAYIPSAPTRAAEAFDGAVSSFNIYGGIWELGAGAIFAENETLRWLADLLEWPSTAGGCFVPGGTMGNLSALVAARDHIRRQGRAARAILCTRDAHSSINSAARVMDSDLVLVDADERGHLTGAAAAAALAEHPEVFAVVASVGTTNCGVIDDIADIADVCEQFGVWLHIDGAYGGAGLAAPSVRARYVGIERANSFIIDPHKWLFVPYDCCALLYRDAAIARAAHAQHASYLDVINRDVWNPADFAVHLSRRTRGLPFWFSLATHGTLRYAAAVEQTLRTAREIADGIRSIPTLRLRLEPELSVIVFDRPGWTADDYHRWSTRLRREGRILCLPTTFREEMVLRLALVNPATLAEHVLDILRETTVAESP